jgi:hypothetical protein
MQRDCPSMRLNQRRVASRDDRKIHSSEYMESMRGLGTKLTIADRVATSKFRFGVFQNTRCFVSHGHICVN